METMDICKKHNIKGVLATGPTVLETGPLTKMGLLSRMRTSHKSETCAEIFGPFPKTGTTCKKELYLQEFGLLARMGSTPTSGAYT
jgi:hypothetical protein